MLTSCCVVPQMAKDEDEESLRDLKEAAEKQEVEYEKLKYEFERLKEASEGHLEVTELPEIRTSMSAVIITRCLIMMLCDVTGQRGCRGGAG